MDGHLQVQPQTVAAATPAISRAANGAPRPVRLLDQVRWQIRQLHYSWRTEDAYVYWCRAFIRFHGLRHPAEMGVPEMEAFLGWLANERRVATSTHRQALSALLFLYAKVLRIDLPRLGEIGRPRTQRRLPVVLSRDEVVVRAECPQSCLHLTVVGSRRSTAMGRFEPVGPRRTCRSRAAVAQ